VFGRVVRGTKILNYFNPPFPSGVLYTIDDPSLPPGSYLPAYSPDKSNAFFVNLNITLLTAQILQVQGGNKISWESVEGCPNIVESSSTFPPTWQQVTTVTGTGASMSITNDPGRAIERYYRVRIDYTQ
jgi:hypothetical protein